MLPLKQRHQYMMQTALFLEKHYHINERQAYRWMKGADIHPKSDYFIEQSPLPPPKAAAGTLYAKNNNL
ncbi:hypothetical protein [Alkalicoccus chagannorensis]|uniref:hypothetical protein n=1 Tax=Alkalicoccus chagannorensis TaxID=427072 RepID=UPI000426B810|nr:hypothetical protein [Alkalicoccus chagannorensis]